MSIYNNSLASALSIPQNKTLLAIEDLSTKPFYDNQIDSLKITKQFLKSYSMPEYEKFKLIASHLDTCIGIEKYNTLKIMKKIPIRFDGIECTNQQLEKVLRSIKKIIDYSIEYNATNFITIEPELLNTEPKLQNDKAIWMNAMRLNPNGLRLASTTFQNEDEFVLEAVKINGLSLRFASDQVKNNRKVVEAAMGENPLSLAFASKELKQDVSLLKLMPSNFKLPTKICSLPLEAGESLREFNQHILKLLIEGNENNKELVLAIIKIDPLMLKYASTSLQNDADIVTAAAKKDKRALQYAGVELLKENHTFNKDIITYKAQSFDKQPIEVRSHRKIAKAAINQDYLNYKYISLDLKKDIAFAIKAIQVNPKTFFSVDPSIQMNEDILRTTLEGDGSILEFLPRIVRHDPKFVFVALNNYSGKTCPFKFAGLAIKSNLDHCATAFGIDPKSIKHSYLNEDKIKLSAQKIGALENFSKDLTIELKKIDI